MTRTVCIIPVLAIAMLTMTIIGCGGDDDNNNGGTGMSANIYYPLSVGRIWEFQDSSDMGIDTSTTEIVGITEIDGRQSYINIDEDENGQDTSYLQSRADGIYSLTRGTIWMRNMLSSVVKSMQSGFTEIKILPATFAIGTNWEVISLDSTWENAGIRYHAVWNAMGSVISRENIVTPAGTFSNCVKIRMDHDMQITTIIIAYADTYHYVSAEEYLLWLAPNVGPAKGQYMGADTTASVLISYSTGG